MKGFYWNSSNINPEKETIFQCYKFSSTQSVARQKFPWWQESPPSSPGHPSGDNDHVLHNKTQDRRPDTGAGQSIEKNWLRLRLISAPLNHRLNQFSAHKLPLTCWLTDIGRHVRQRLWQWIYRKPNFGSWLFHNFNSWVLCPLSFDIVRRLKHHDFSQQEFQLAYSRLYDFLMAEGSKTYCCGGHLSILPNLLLFPYIMPDPSMPATGPSCRLKLL